MTMPSILFLDTATTPEEPGFFRDLNLDQVTNHVFAGMDDWKPLFYAALKSPDAILQRQNVMRDIEHADVQATLRAFTLAMTDLEAMRHRAETSYYPLQQQLWFLEAGHTYCQLVERLVVELADSGDVASDGLRAVLHGTREYVASDGFRQFARETSECRAELEAIRYSLHIRGNVVMVSADAETIDYRRDIEETFNRFRSQTVRHITRAHSDQPDMNHVEAQILDLVARLNPEPFTKLAAYVGTYHERFVDPGIAQFHFEVQFYLKYWEFMHALAHHGLVFCYPEIATDGGDIYVYNGFDMALADKLSQTSRAPTVNDFSLRGSEQMAVVTGPNQGGKSTFARMVGQVHHVARLGLPVPARRARLPVCDHIFTHFESGEPSPHEDGKLADDLRRIHAILQEATSQSLIILNEIFSSTTLKDARFLGARILARIAAKGANAVVVTFIEEWAVFNEKTVSLASEVFPDNPSRRTFKILRQPSGGRFYAMMLAQKHGVTYEEIKERISHASGLDASRTSV